MRFTFVSGEQTWQQLNGNIVPFTICDTTTFPVTCHIHRRDAKPPAPRIGEAKELPRRHHYSVSAQLAQEANYSFKGDGAFTRRVKLRDGSPCIDRARAS